MTTSEILPIQKWGMLHIFHSVWIISLQDKSPSIFHLRAGEMSRQLRALVAFAEDPRSIQVQFLAPTLAGSQPVVTPVVGDLISSSRLHGYLHSHMHIQTELKIKLQKSNLEQSIKANVILHLKIIFLPCLFLPCLFCHLYPNPKYQSVFIQ